MKKIKLILLTQILIFLGCNKSNKINPKENEEIMVETIQPSEMNTELLKQKIIKSKDLNAFKYYYIKQREKDFDEDNIKLSKIIFDEHNFNPALDFLIFSYFKKHNPDYNYSFESKEKYFKNIPKEDLNVLLKYINIGVEKNDYSCIQKLSDYYKFLGDKKNQSNWKKV